MVSQPKYVRIRQSVLGNTPYPIRISRYLFLSRIAYALWRSVNILWRTAYLMAIIYWIRLAPREAVPILIPDQKPLSTSKNPIRQCEAPVEEACDGIP